MAVGLSPPAELLPVAGVRVGAGRGGIKTPGRRDVAVFELAEDSTCATVFTRNRFAAAPVVVAREHLHRASIRYWLVNAGNANAGNGASGLDDARASCAALAARAGCRGEAVLPFSTGVIGEPLPVDALSIGTDEALRELDDAGWSAAAEAIMTTDTVAKGASRQLTLEGVPVTLTGVVKGSGMIRPDMATMLAFVATDAAIDAPVLQRALDDAVAVSFNRVTVDGDTSTNDAVALAATGKSGVALGATGEGFAQWREALTDLCTELAQAIVRDGEGATKFITLDVGEGRDEAECLSVAYAVAHSPLVKTAFYASDPNWGRILAAVGRAGIADLDLAGVAIDLDDVALVRAGARATEYREPDGQRVMARSEITVRIRLGRGAARARVWTCDLSHQYVTINAEYRT